MMPLLLIKPGLWALGIVFGGATVSRWWGRKKDDVQTGAVAIIGFFFILVGAYLALKMRGIFK